MTAGIHRDPYIDCDRDGCLHRLFASNLELPDGSTVADVRRVARFRGWQTALESPRGKGEKRLDRCPDDRIDLVEEG